MICKGCGEENRDSFETCRSCGASLVRKCRLATLSWRLTVHFMPALFLLAIVLVLPGLIGIHTDCIAWIAATLAILAPFAGLAVGMIAIAQILISRGRMQGLTTAIWGTLASAAVVSGFALIWIAMARMPEQARKSQCMENIRECSIALQLYYNEYDAKLPSSYLCNHSKSWNKADFVRFASSPGTVAPSSSDKPPATDVASPKTWPELLYDHMKSKDIMRCPSDPADIYDKNAQVSYFWKAAVDRAWYEGMQNESDFAYNSDQIIFYEHGGWHSNDEESGLTDGVRVNVAFLDGHAKTCTITNASQTRASRMTSPLPKCGVGEPAWFNWNYDKRPGTQKGSRGQNWDPHSWGDHLPGQH